MISHPRGASAVGAFDSNVGTALTLPSTQPSPTLFGQMLNDDGRPPVRKAATKWNISCIKVNGRQYRIATNDPDEDKRRWMAPITTEATRKPMMAGCDSCSMRTIPDYHRNLVDKGSIPRYYIHQIRPPR